MTWLEENKEWFLSGAGIFLISSIVSFASIILTLWFKSRSEKKKLKKLLILSNTTKFSAPALTQFQDISVDNMSISYKGQEYKDLSLFSIQIKNIGMPAILQQKLHLTIPLDSIVIEFSEEKSMESIIVKKQELIGKNKKEIIYTLDRLESNDIFNALYLINTKNEEEITCDARGVDGIEYYHKDEIDRPQIEKLITYFAVFIFAGAIPFGDSIRAVIVLMASPLLISLYKSHIKNRDNDKNSITVHGGIRVDESGTLHINQMSKET